MRILDYDYLPTGAMEVRIKVFVEEQGFVDEMDSTDNMATHLVMFDGEKAVATCRIFKGDKGYTLGRLAVLKEYRKKGLGKEMLSRAERVVKDFGGKSLVLHSQLRAKEFYIKCGYTQFGEIELEENYPHIWMRKEL